MAITRTEYAERLLRHLGVEPRKRAITCLLGWMFAESGTNPCTGKSGEGARFNPLNTTKSLGVKCDMSDYNSTGVKNYASQQCGVDATAATLQLDYYRDVIRALKRVALPGWKNKFAQAVGDSPWGTSAAGVTAGINAVEDKPSYRIITVG